jgi:hypothetical protein
VTSLAPDIKAEYDKKVKDGNASLDIAVKAGQLVGRIGGQTLDFAVWDTEKPLTGFIVPDHYQAEEWKLYTADPLDYYTPDLKALALSRYVRTAEPISGGEGTCRLPRMPMTRPLLLFPLATLMEKQRSLPSTAIRRNRRTCQCRPAWSNTNWSNGVGKSPMGPSGITCRSQKVSN